MNQMPANLPAEELRQLLKDRRAVRFEAVPVPACFRLKIGFNKHTGLPSGQTLPMTGWAIIAIEGVMQESVALGLPERDARIRAAALNLPTAPATLDGRN